MTAAKTIARNPKIFDISKIFSDEPDNAAMIAWTGIQRYKKKLINNLNFEPKSRWPLDKSAPYMKGPGLKL